LNPLSFTGLDVQDMLSDANPMVVANALACLQVSDLHLRQHVFMPSRIVAAAL
jgi:vesicle coat complex subunit